MRLNKRGIFDPRFSRAFARVDGNGIQASVLVRRRKPETDDSKATWNYTTGSYTGDDFIQVWSGGARLQPALDWRAKDYTFASVTTATSAMRVVMPLFGGEWAIEDHHLNMEDQIIVTGVAFKGNEELMRFPFIIRNTLPNSAGGSLNAMCDVDLKQGVNLAYQN